MIYNERRTTVFPQNVTVLAESAAAPFCPLPLPLSIFSFEIKEKEKESREKAGKARATVWRG
ncbi:hypothetical protein [Ralstonia solanacearum]|uniref:hypothetical protein n=1 Tax=Ralstonia solanacearum TaxID=305 RepID=UPI0013012598|nr:hypothetical protein [Ralstonia solanacearum]